MILFFCYFREWKHFRYEEKSIRFADGLGSPEGKDVIGSINLHQFSSASVPKVQDRLCMCVLVVIIANKLSAFCFYGLHDMQKIGQVGDVKLQKSRYGLDIDLVLCLNQLHAC